MPTTIRALHPDDAEQMFELRCQALINAPLAFLASPEDDIASSVEAVRDLLNRGPNALVFGAFDTGGSQLVGMVGLYRSGHAKSAHKVHIWGMYVRPQARRQGLARQLLDAAIDHARTLERVRSLHISASDTAAEAKNLYEQAGFQIWGIEPEAICYNGQLVQEFHMLLPLMRG